ANWWEGFTIPKIVEGANRAVRESLAKAAHDVEEGLRKRIDGDVKELLKWAAANHHTLGHRASMRQLLMSSNHPLLQAFRKLEVPEAERIEYSPLAASHKEYPYFIFRSDAGK